MSKKSSSIPGFEAAYGTIIVVPDVDDHSVGGMQVPVKESELPSGTVVAIGQVPRHFWFHRLKIGSKAVYARAAANQIKLPVNGEMRVCKAILWSDLRGSFPPEKEPSGGSILPYAKKNFFLRVKTWVWSVGGVFAAGALLGVVAAPFIYRLSSVKLFFKRLRGKFASMFKRNDGSNGT